ncbi:putative exported protein of unknown function [Rhodopseudomonas palustris TIE-1]|uniref:hypothetical protein n=1 Tax=Rhodopseudomonas palustris TaxID=1076 RepID=UPI000164B516|nr:hypothetical protein [Rhodopseudomonas palustris]ACF02641.1 putative exported protein of unknown function [Rhodopseudomonas palustris TIE-1]
MAGKPMIALALLVPLLWSPAVTAQDVPGIEICTVEKTMERRTSCLQSNVDFLHKSLDKARLDQQQKLDAARAQIAALSAAVVALQKQLADLQAAQKPAKSEPAPAKDAAQPKDASPPKTDAK